MGSFAGYFQHRQRSEGQWGERKERKQSEDWKENRRKDVQKDSGEK
jgi:hypothetical protein